MKLSLLLVALLGACGELDGAFVCSSDKQCVAHEGAGRCEPSTHACSFADATCPSGWRYGSLDGKGLAGTCTSTTDLGDDDLGGDDLSSNVDGGMLSVAHLAGEQAGGMGALLFSATGDLGTGSTIDTTALQIDGRAPPMGVSFEIGHEATTGAELAVLRVDTLTIEAGVTVNVIGARGLVVVASGDVEISGVIDAGARWTTPGPGGGAPGAGLGAGVAVKGTYGASGAGYGTEGSGGNPGRAGVNSDAGVMQGGPEYGDAPITILLGGSGGGNGTNAGPGGAGGGILQISSATLINVADPGGINVGGGGALGVNSEAGGGSGGSIFLEAPIVRASATLASNGGGASGLACAQMPLTNGANGALSTSPAQGGAGCYNAGGSGGAIDSAPTPGGFCPTCSATTGGGGGGAVGRIVIAYQQSYFIGGNSSPAPTVMHE